MIAAAQPDSPSLSRETFFSLWWSHARDTMREGVCQMARVYLGGGWVPWDKLADQDRRRIRAELVRMLEAHESSRQRQRAAGAY